ncbi:hypothetical protein ANCCEY_05903 [Ancylostoma ceylanicum]|uniref:Uncharacterized protein n=1 Tax=Ancylostoma ceylanicum TaxID=53326 RepID=A0A0D6LSY4_9BILA|nr:hypothetical protein ANCCEY_05903 [Ancylostoma ceylanicum]
MPINDMVDKQRWRELTMFGRKKDKEQTFNDDYAAISRKAKDVQPTDTKKKSNTLSIAVPAVDAQSDPPPTPNGTLNIPNRPQRISSPPRPPPPSIRPPDVFAAQIPAKMEQTSLISARQGEPPSSEPRQNCPPIPDRPTSAPRVMTPPIYERFDGPQCKVIAPPDVPAPPVPRQISPGTLYKPTAPPRPSAPRAKVITVDTSEDLSNGEGSQPLDDSCAVTSSLDRRSGGVLAKRHSIKIDTNTVVESDLASWAIFGKLSYPPVVLSTSCSRQHWASNELTFTMPAI